MNINFSYNEIEKIISDFRKRPLKTSIIIVCLIAAFWLMGHLGNNQSQPKQIIKGSNNAQQMTIGNNSPIIYQQNFYNKDLTSDVSIDKITQLRQRVLWSHESGGDRQSYEKLLNWLRTCNDSYIHGILLSEIRIVKENYNTNIMHGRIDNLRVICKPSNPHVNCAQGFEDSKGFSAQNVLDHLASNKRWDERARAACLLRNISTALGKDKIDKTELFEKLVRHMKPEEESLCVAKMAFETYKDLAKFSSNEVFDFERAIEDWALRRSEILEINF